MVYSLGWEILYIQLTYRGSGESSGKELQSLVGFEGFGDQEYDTFARAVRSFALC
jgi:hypothetical protein